MVEGGAGVALEAADRLRPGPAPVRDRRQAVRRSLRVLSRRAAATSSVQPTAGADPSGGVTLTLAQVATFARTSMRPVTVCTRLPNGSSNSLTVACCTGMRSAEIIQPAKGRPAFVSVTLVQRSNVLSMLTRSVGSTVAIGAELRPDRAEAPRAQRLRTLQTSDKIT